VETFRRRWITLALEVGPVLALVVLGIVTTDHPTKSEWLAYLLLALPLAVRRWWPIPVLVVVGLFSVLATGDLPGPWVPIGLVAIAGYAVGERASDRTRSAVVTLFVGGAIGLGLVAQDAATIPSLVLPFVVIVPAWLAGDTVRARRLDAAARVEAAARQLREAQARAAAAAAEERRRMARDLHDVVAHGVSVMVIQAGAARQVVETSPGRATESLLTIEATGREVMSELRRMLGALNDDGEAASLAPQPGIDQVAPLVERVRQAGLPAELQVDGDPRPVPASLDVTAYRIVQEALTNALRYARQARTTVHIAYEPDQLRLEVLDDGPGGTADSEGAGRGLAGMRQRAELIGGRLEAGRRLGGGFAVRAWLPLDAEPGADPVAETAPAPAPA
jgi:signal transduction histidine kinase